MSFVRSTFPDFNQSLIDATFSGLVQRFQCTLPKGATLRALNLNDFPIDLDYFDASAFFGLLPPEQPLIANAVPKRIREFALGRSCLRQALSDLHDPSVLPLSEGIPIISGNIPILSGKMREPILPPSVSASITHCETVCMAVAVQKNAMLESIGIDCESYIPLDTALIDYITTEREQVRYLISKENFHLLFNRLFLKNPLFEPQSMLSKEYWAKLIFSLKESYYKAYFQITGCFLDFLEVEVELDFHQPLAYIRLCNPSEAPNTHPLLGMGYYTITDGYVLSAVTIAPYTQRS